MEKRNFKSVKLIFLFVFGLLSQAFAQNSKPEMADLMRENGKIYVVVAVLTIVFSGIIVYLISIDRKTRRLENELNELKK